MFYTREKLKIKLMTLGTVAQTSKPAAEEAEAEALTLRHSGGKAA